MRSINQVDISKKLLSLINEEDPIDEDIVILDNDGAIKSAVITKDAYDFFLKKIEEEEDRVDAEAVSEFNISGEKNE